MGFGGSVSAMISSIKANRALLKKKSYFKSVDVNYKMSESLNDKYPKATHKQLEEIRNEVIKSEQRVMAIRMVFFIVLLLGGLYWFVMKLY